MYICLKESIWNLATSSFHIIRQKKYIYLYSILIYTIVYQREGGAMEVGIPPIKYFTGNVEMVDGQITLLA